MRVVVCPSCGEENPDRFRLCGFCGAELTPAPAKQELRKTVTIVFSDLKGSTSLGERLDPEALREVLRRYFEEMRSVLEAHGGRVEKYIGDAVMAVFGLPRVREDDALRAVRAAAGMQEALAALNDELERRWGVALVNRTGVNTGELVVGERLAGDHLVTGDAVNVAARLEQAAGEYEVLIGEPTYRLVRDAVDVEEVEPLALKGKAEPVPAYRLVAVREREAGFARRSDAPLVGREAELAVLLGEHELSVLDRSCRCVTILGDAGLGKSRLSQALAESVGDRSTVLRGRCLSYGEGITFWPIVEIVRDAAAIQESDTADVARSKLLALVGDDLVVARLVSAVGLSLEQLPVEELFWGIRKLFERLAAERPLVVVFDDIHWAEPVFLDLIRYLVDSTEEAPLLLVCPARHELLERHPDLEEQ
ncbi:MAG TPA: adenylate/guanylate cyclase domain-containing protein, partial [Gaiellaceae bacterium]|nr:adenylate/guanylate cyclase domain-containing protein [Gaiellaceae bacterium]